jgi:hypothetical protein
MIEQEIREILEKLFYEYLHTVIFFHEREPNEPNRQVIFKQEIPELIEKIISIISQHYIPKDKIDKQKLKCVTIKKDVESTLELWSVKLEFIDENYIQSKYMPLERVIEFVFNLNVKHYIPKSELPGVEEITRDLEDVAKMFLSKETTDKLSRYKIYTYQAESIHKRMKGE